MVSASIVLAWGNGQAGNAQTDQASECSNPPYSTHDWIADHALALLPDEEKAWLIPHNTLYLLGTEAPDNNDIPASCGGPNMGYDDRSLGHSVEWRNKWTDMFKDRAAVRADEEYRKAVAAFQDDDPAAAAFFLGAMAHYIGDVSQYGHAVAVEQHHGDYESWAGARTAQFDDGNFESYVTLDSLVRRTPYTAAKRISRATGQGQGTIRSATWMDQHFSAKNAAYIDSVGNSLNLAANELADVLHRFFLDVVED